MARLTEDLLAAYRATRYCAWPHGELLELRIGQRNPALGALLEQHGHTTGCFITAWNPLSAAHTRDQNDRANALLERNLRRSGWTLFPGEGRGQDPTWEAEASFLVLGTDRYDTAGFAYHYRQHAAVYFERSVSPRLLIPGRLASRDKAFRGAGMLVPKLAERESETGIWKITWPRETAPVVASTQAALFGAFARELRHRGRAFECERGNPAMDATCS